MVGARKGGKCDLIDPEAKPDRKGSQGQHHDRARVAGLTSSRAPAFLRGPDLGVCPKEGRHGADRGDDRRSDRDSRTRDRDRERDKGRTADVGRLGQGGVEREDASLEFRMTTHRGRIEAAHDRRTRRHQRADAEPERRQNDGRPVLKTSDDQSDRHEPEGSGHHDKAGSAPSADDASLEHGAGCDPEADRPAHKSRDGVGASLLMEEENRRQAEDRHRDPAEKGGQQHPTNGREFEQGEITGHDRGCAARYAAPHRAPLRPRRTSPERVILAGGGPPALRPSQTIPLRMKIVVAIKQVAVLDDEFELLADSSGVDPDFLDFEPNEWDQFSLEAGLALREAAGGGEVVAITVGDEEAEEGLLGALAKGADRGVRVWDEELAGADALAVARVLATAVSPETPDLVLCGVQSADAVSSATGIALAGYLGLPRVAVVKRIELDGTTATVERELEDGLVERLRIGLPALLTVQTGINEPRYATLRAIKQARDKPLAVLSLSDVGFDAGGVAAAAGSRRRRLAHPERREGAEILEGSTADVAATIVSIVRDRVG